MIRKKNTRLIIAEKSKLKTHTVTETQELGVDFCVWAKIPSVLPDSIAKPHIAHIQDHRPVFGVELLRLSFEGN